MLPLNSRHRCEGATASLAIGKAGDAARARLGAVAKGIDPKAEPLEQPFVAPRRGVDRAGIDLLGRRPVMHDQRSSLLRFVTRARSIHCRSCKRVRQDPSRMRPGSITGHPIHLLILYAKGRTPIAQPGSSRRASDFLS